MYGSNNGGGLGCLLGVIRLTGRALIRPFTCDKGDRPLVVVLWLLMVLLLGGATLYAIGPYEHRETLNYVAGAAAISGLGLWLVVGAWGRDLEEVRADFDDPLDEYDGSGPSSGREGEPF